MEKRREVVEIELDKLLGFDAVGQINDTDVQGAVAQAFNKAGVSTEGNPPPTNGRHAACCGKTAST